MDAVQAVTQACATNLGWPAAMAISMIFVAGAAVLVALIKYSR